MRSVKPRIVVNAAAYTAVDRAESEPEVARAVNSDAPALLAAEAARFDAVMIHYSTDYVFNGAKETAYVETDPANPASVYGRTKLEGEQAVAQVENHFILRCSWVYSTRGSNFLKTMLRLGAERSEIGVVDDQAGSPTWAREIARSTAGLLALMRPDGTDGKSKLSVPRGIYHLTSGERATWFEFALAIFDRFPEIQTKVRPITTAEYPTAAARPRNSVLDSSKIATTLGIRMPPWETQLDECLTSAQ